MDLNKWLKRKYPAHYDSIKALFSDETVEHYLKNLKYDLGILLKNNGKNKAGYLVIYNRRKEMIEENQNGYEYPNEGGWTGQFEYFYVFPKHHDMLYPFSYILLCKPIIPYLNQKP